MKKIEIFRATSNDISKINEIVRLSKGYWGYNDLFLDEFMEKFAVSEEAISNNPVYCGIFDNEMIGIFAFKKNDKDQDELDLFFMHPAFIGKGLGKQLWVACLEIAKQLGIRKFVITGDPNSEGFYLKMGCKRIKMVDSPMSLIPGRQVPILEYDKLA